MKATTIALILALTITVTLLTLPIATAHEPAWTIKSWSYVAVTPNPVGVGQQVQAIFWADSYPRTAAGALGDRFTFSVHVTEPDGTKETLGPFTSDPVGGSFTVYTPDQVGTYTFVAELHEHLYTGVPGRETNIFVGDTYLGSQSGPSSLTVQQEPLMNWPASELPTEYWTRPIDAGLREWSEIAGNWLADGRGNPYTTGPETAHIMWTKPVNLGGIVGEPFGDISYYTGSSYEGAWVELAEGGSWAGKPAVNLWFNNPVIMNGRLYYNVPLGHSNINTRMKFVCVDLRTGEQLWEVNGTKLEFGWIQEVETPNQSGGHGYLWTDRTHINRAIGGGTVDIYDPLTGTLEFTITNVPRGSPWTFGVDPHGAPLIYTLNSGGWLSCWNASYITTMTAAPLSAETSASWQWRPVGKTHNGTTGYVWNVTVPQNLGAINYVLPDRLIGTSGMDRYTSSNHSIWAISTEPGQEGQLLWKEDFVNPPAGEWTVDRLGPWSLEDGVLCINNKETRTWWGYNLDTGKLLWGPTEPQGTDFDMYYSGSLGQIAYGKLFSASYSGIVHAYDVKTGELLWTAETDKCGLEGPYERVPTGTGSGVTIADGKLYYTTHEHSMEHPLYRYWRMYCFDAENGEQLWSISSLGPGPTIADGYLVGINYLNYQIHVYGKGPTATTVSIQNDVIPWGNSALIKGTVTDESAGTKSSALTPRFPNGVPAIADEDMTPWMEYVYHQHAMPLDAVGVEVTLETLDPNGNFYEIGKVTSDASGMYKLLWEPPVPGEYTIIARFAGSESYWRSTAETALGVTEAPSPGAPIEPEPTTPEPTTPEPTTPEPTTPEPTTPEPTTPEPTEPEPTTPAETPLITTEIAIIAAVAVACVIGIVSFWALRKRK